MAISHNAPGLPRPSKIQTAAAHLANHGRDTARRIIAGAIGNALNRNELARVWSEIDQHPALARAVADFRAAGAALSTSGRS